MNNAELFPCTVIKNPDDLKYDESIRLFQGCPTVAVTKGGRIFLGWYAGGIKEPHMNNYNLLIYSDDKGKTWSDPVLIIPSSYEMSVHALDIQLFIDPKGALHVCWVQNNTLKTNEPIMEISGKPAVKVDGYAFLDFKHSEWEDVCNDPDAEELSFSAPRYLYQGFLRCKPTFLKNGDWLCFAYDQLCDKYGYSISRDGGETFTHYYGPKKVGTVFDETMAYEKNDGSVRMLARTYHGYAAESYSYDNGRTWSEAVSSGITHADTRLFAQRLPSGRVMLIVNEDAKVRKNITVKLSEDDGVTWKYSKLIDAREDISYPDADYNDGVIYLTYDRGRTTHKEILFTSFTEQDIIDNNEINLSIVSKAPENVNKTDIIKAVEEHKIIAILRGVPKDKLLSTATALYNGGIRLIEVTFDASGKESDQETFEKIKLLADNFKDKMYIGAGTVLTENQVRLTKKAGGTFIISPDAKEEVIFESHLCGLVSIPGVITPSEITSAVSFGADFVKIFPAFALGSGYIKAVKAPLSNVRILAVGGIDDTNLQEYLKAGACGVGVGSNIVPKKLLDNNDFDGIKKLAEKYVLVANNG